MPKDKARRPRGADFTPAQKKLVVESRLSCVLEAHTELCMDSPADRDRLLRAIMEVL